MDIKICKKRQSILDEHGHTLVTGGPGCGKTTIALLKALDCIKAGLSDGQCVLFLSFSRAAVARIAEAAKKQIPKSQQKLLNIQTFHSFFWEILRGYGYLLGSPKRLTLLAPHDEKAMSNGIDRDDKDPAWQAWKTERERLFREKGLTAFDLFAPKAAELLARSARIREITSDRYPLIIVDEAQDTGPEQWSCIRALSNKSQVLCLADLDQQIFDFLPGIGPERIQQIEEDLHPVLIDLGSENNRSPDSEIAVFGHDVLTGTTRSRPYKGVSQIDYHPKAEKRDLSIRQSIGMMIKKIQAETGRSPDSIAILTSYDRGAAIVSNALQAGKVIPHKVLFDESMTLLSSRFLAFLMEPKQASDHSRNLAEALVLLSAVFRAKGAAGALRQAKELQLWAQYVLEGKVPTRAKLYKELDLLLMQLQCVAFSGDPRKDWMLLRSQLKHTGVAELKAVDQALQYLMVFNRGKRIASGLSSVWETKGDYSSARQVLDTALAEDQILSGGEDLSGIHVMTMHKSKGKQFDGVIIFRAEHSSPFVWPRDPDPYRKSRKVLRVAITRARFHTMILNQAFPTCSILSQHKLS